MKKSEFNKFIEDLNIDTFIDDYKNHTEKFLFNKYNIDKSTLNQLIKHFNLKKSKLEKRLSIENDYGSREKFYSDRQSKTNKTKIEKYGSLDNANSVMAKNMIQGRIDKYGSLEDYSKSMYSNVKNTMIQKYGVDNISKLDSIKEKKKLTMISNYGSLEEAYKQRNSKSYNTWINRYGSLDSYWAMMHEKSKDTFIEKYGVSNPFSCDEIKDKIKATCLEKYGVEYACLIDYVRNSPGNNSKPNKEFEYLLTSRNIKYSTEYVLGRYAYDFKVNDILIEIDPYATHNVMWGPYGDMSGVDKSYHQLKTLNAQLNGYKCIHVFDWIDKEDVIQNLSKARMYSSFDEPREFIYNVKLNKLVKDFTNDCVIIYDDGGVI